MKKLELKEMEKVNGGDCAGIRKRFARSRDAGRKWNTQRLLSRIERKCQ